MPLTSSAIYKHNTSATKRATQGTILEDTYSKKLIRYINVYRECRGSRSGKLAKIINYYLQSTAKDAVHTRTCMEMTCKVRGSGSDILQSEKVLEFQR